MINFQTIMRQARARANRDQSSARMREIIKILSKYNLQEGISPEKVTSILQDLGPTFVKLGQIASGHPDMLPSEYCEALAKLRADVEPMPFEVVRKQVEEQIGCTLEEAFETFDTKALGSASIAQVHRATLKDSHTEVAVKVQRPGIAETVGSDIALLDRAAAQLELFDIDMGQISIDDVISELERATAEELNFAVEADNLEQFLENNINREKIHSPKCYRELSTESILVMDYAAGSCIDDAEALGKMTGEERETLAYLIAYNYVQQMLEDGFFHADPHSGNVVHAEDGGIEWIDFGMMGTLSKRDRGVLQDATTAIVRNNAYDLKRALLNMCTAHGPIDHAAVLTLCESMVDSFSGENLDDLDIGALLNDSITQLQGQGFTIKPSIIMVSRGLITLEGTIHAVSSDLNIAQVLSRYISESFDPSTIRKQAQRTLANAADSARAAISLPTRADETLDMLQKGNLSVGTDLKVEDDVKDTAVVLVDRASSVLLAAALFVGSCILCTTNLQPQILGVPVLGVIGFAIGFLLAAYNIWEMEKAKRRRKSRRRR